LFTKPLIRTLPQIDQRSIIASAGAPTPCNVYHRPSTYTNLEDRSIVNRAFIAATIAATIAALGLLTLTAATPAMANLYSYMNEQGDYVVTQKRPKNADEYAVLSNDGEFLHLVRPIALDVPVSHWQPWYLPKQANPFAPDQPDQEAKPSVIIEEVDAATDE
jgi:hypothetical protein